MNFNPNNENYISNSINDLENKEQLDLPPVYIIYRDNDLYSKLVPGIMANLQEFGRKVNVKSFQRGSDQEIKDWFADQKNQEEVGKSKRLIDETSNERIPYEVKENWNSQDTEKLDFLSNEIMNKIFFGERREIRREFLQKQEKNDTIKRCLADFYCVVKKLLENKKNEPKEILIVKKMLSDHDGFSMIEQILEGDEEQRERFMNDFELKKEELPNFLKGILRARGGAGTEEEKKIVDRYHEFIAEKIKEVLVENGVRENIIKVVPEITSDLDGEGNWVVVDRHEESKGPSLTKPLKITFPSDSMIECLQRQGLADIGEFDWKEISKDLIEKKFKV